MTALCAMYKPETAAVEHIGGENRRKCTGCALLNLVGVFYNKGKSCCLMRDFSILLFECPDYGIFHLIYWNCSFKEEILEKYAVQYDWT